MLPAKTIRSALGETTASYPVPFLGVGGLASGILVLLIAIHQPSGSAGFWPVSAYRLHCSWRPQP